MDRAGCGNVTGQLNTKIPPGDAILESLGSLILSPLGSAMDATTVTESDSPSLWKLCPCLYLFETHTPCNTIATARSRTVVINGHDDVLQPRARSGEQMSE
ncbi:hypothetical protein RRF57_004253 [Xylaria bambusicola]|uniref:Uncharacterized protein n=1 Tax=Xylaria bambusicola TaxID=326684 RepID=A0AAN7Z6B0_9PEZI